ncbi:MAG: helicase domain protein, partial [Acidimicrobiaceae bacterium]|nr:helicase domain protein [Acidimicrobiaceae bacterium]
MTDDITSFQVRAELEDLLERDLLGPRDGAEEELPLGTSPAERYMLGRLVPRERPTDRSGATDNTEPDDTDAIVDAEESDPSLVDGEVSAAVGDDANDEGDAGAATVRSGSMAASAIGLAFSVPTDVDVISVTASWGRYERRASEHHETPQGRPA